MAIKIKVKKPAPQPAVDIGHLKGTAKRLAELILEHGSYEFEGFTWLQGNFEGIADALGVNEKTIRRIVKSPPFHYTTRVTKEDGRHILLKLGTEPCENDHVIRLRKVWVQGIAFYNAAASKAWTIKVMQLKHQKAPKELWDRLLHRIKAAEEKAVDADKLKAGEPISYEVQQHEMGMLREVVKNLADDAYAVIACLTTFEGWHMFISYAKIASRVTHKHYHFPYLGVIAANPDIALQTYLDMAQGAAKLGIAECARLNAKIESLTPPLAA